MKTLIDLDLARLIVLIGAAIGFISLIIAVIALRRVRASSAVIAIALGVLVIAVTLILANITNGFGTRGADFEAMGALILGMVGGSLGEIALVRLRENK